MDDPDTIGLIAMVAAMAVVLIAGKVQSRKAKRNDRTQPQSNMKPCPDAVALKSASLTIGPANTFIGTTFRLVG
jgi:hypothetical protein